MKILTFGDDYIAMSCDDARSTWYRTRMAEETRKLTLARLRRYEYERD